MGRPAAFTQAEYDRAIRAAKKNGVHQVEMRDAKGNSCVFLLTVEPASAGGNDNSAVDQSPRIIL